MDDLNYNLLLQDSDADENQYDCSNLDESVAHCDWQPHESSDEEFSSDEKETKEKYLSDVLRNLAMEEDEEDSNDEDTADNTDWTDYIGRHKLFSYVSQGGLQTSILPNFSSVEGFHVLIDGKVINHIVCKTSRYADQKVAAVPPKLSSRLKK